MMSCKEVTKLVSQNLDRDLSLWIRMGLRMHLTICRGCSAYKRQILFLDKVVTDHYREGQFVNNRHDLPDDSLERIKESLRAGHSHPS